MKKRTKPIISIGTSCILLIFLSLCLLTFAILSLASAQADLRLSEKIAERTASYYQGEARASRLLADLNQELSSQFSLLETQADVLSVMADFLTKEAYSFSVSDASVSFQVPSAEDQQLFIVLTAEFPSSSYGSFFTVSAWETESTREWSPDTHQDVYQPGKNEDLWQN